MKGTERKIGETFTTSKGTFEVAESDSCVGCFLYRGTGDILSQCGHNAFSKKLTGPCSKLRRSDGRKVIFKKIQDSDMDTMKPVYKGETVSEIDGADSGKREVYVSDSGNGYGVITVRAERGDCLTKDGRVYLWDGEAWRPASKFVESQDNEALAKDIALRKYFMSDYCYDLHSVEAGAKAMAEEKDRVVGNALQSRYALLDSSGFGPFQNAAEIINDIYRELFGKGIDE